MKTFDIYVEHYIEENTYTVYIHHGEPTNDLVHPIEEAENISFLEAQYMTNDLIVRYTLHGKVKVNIYEYEDEFNVKSIKTLTSEEFKQIKI